MLRFQRADNVLYEIVDAKAVLVHPDGSELLTLNGTGTLIWEALGDERDVEALADEVLSRTEGVTREQVTADVTAFLEELRGLGVVVATPSS